jgi:hypothetical protein
VRVGDVLMALMPVGRRHRIIGRVLEIFGWCVLVGGTVRAFMAVRSAVG